MTATLEVTDLRKQFAIGRPAIDGVSFAVPAGEIVVLLGPSGCGKTTTLRCVAGLEHPTDGEISIAGSVVSSPAQRHSGAAAAARARHGVPVLCGMAAYDGAAERGLSAQAPQVFARARPDARSTKCWRWSACRNMPTGRWSRCRAARCSAWRWRAASSTGRKLLLLDEPLSNLDAKLRLRLRDDLRVILKQTGMTALYVTHDQAEAVVLGDRIGVMRDGKLLQMDTPDAIYNRPADLFVANFTGATNELAGTLVSRNGEFGMVDFGEGRRGEVALLHALGPDEKVRIALRPENITIGQHNGANIFPARVLDRRYQGTQTAYGIELFGKRLEVRRTRHRRTTSGRHRDAGFAAARKLLGLSRHRPDVV